MAASTSGLSARIEFSDANGESSIVRLNGGDLRLIVRALAVLEADAPRRTAAATGEDHRRQRRVTHARIQRLLNDFRYAGIAWPSNYQPSKIDADGEAA